ncbi:nucleoside 2-deoxyribosyltransferase [Leptospira interrogans]|uniref:Nucleoside 2-deoxyribosyltransferase n=1 Tax=Leptospira interrogans serovar Bataviae TaxID=312175 RepID=A0AAP9WPE6_LEPIR|nr:nucleoside 2-deoxyribosyltransferase [Leptospira interrogans]MCL8311321.1 nucleoside 2-deoxyribosyltransferase [Leptospira interrogans]QOI53161.1 hypothetical protein Lepto1489_22595 [Leptospira interrogans serovar Bataviae]
MSKPQQLFGLVFIEKEPIFSVENSLPPLLPFEKKDFGIIYLTQKSYLKIIQDQNIKSNENYVYLSILREFYLQNQKVLICLKEELSTFNTLGEYYCTTIDDLRNMFPKGIVEKVRRTLLNLSHIQPEYGQRIINEDRYNYFSKNNDEIIYIINILQEKGYITHGISKLLNGSIYINTGIRIEEKGWIEIEEIEKPKNSKQAFIAMWFDKELNEAYNEIRAACSENGFKELKIDNKEHNNEISGEILYEIRHSRFLIADVTGQRAGVYFEAGYAMGLRIPVIWCCREDEIDKVHFDTRQYNHVVWKDEKDLFEKLKKRIKGTIL